MKPGIAGTASICALTLSAASVFAGDHWCPAYPSERRFETAARLTSERSFLSPAIPQAQPGRSALAVSNFIDTYISEKLAQNEVTPALLTDDATFLRRVHLDLTGRIPEPAVVEAFLKNSDPQ